MMPGMGSLDFLGADDAGDRTTDPARGPAPMLPGAGAIGPESAAHGALYDALRARDARFDGRLFVGVTSTGIYCRPICRVRTPMRANCRFFAQAANAEAAGFRPCLRCRPELAPGLSLVDSPNALAASAARLLDAAIAAGQDVALPDVAARLGVTDRHLRRIFSIAHGVRPIDYLTTRRLLLAKQLLTDTLLPVTEVALRAGFASLRRFNDAFVARYRMPPSALRRAVREGPGASARTDAVEVTLGWRPPYDLAGVLAFLSARAVPGLEAVEGLTVRRTLSVPIDGVAAPGWLACRFEPEQHRVHLRLAPAWAPALGTVLQRVRQGLDLDADPQTIDTALSGLPGPEGVRVAGTFDGFEAAVRVVLGQQVSVAAARTLTRRLVEALGEPQATPWADLDRAFPGPGKLAAAEPSALGALGIVRQRVTALQAMAQAVADGRLHLHPAAPVAETMQALQALPGIGPWSAELIALRALAWPDAFPASDLGVLRALGTRDPEDAQQAAQAWRPWRSYAVMRLWQADAAQPLT